ncbi:MAG: hypothetical protein ACTSSE_16145, partial [Candidatus Thorarchaeota archaeon]
RDPIPMNVDKALANFCNSSELRRGGDTGRRRVEHRNFLQLRFTHQNVRYRFMSKTIKFPIVLFCITSSPEDES